MSSTAPLVTAEELERHPPADDFKYELVAGRLVRMSPVGLDHGVLVVRLAYLLIRHLEGQSAGIVVTEAGFTLATNPDTVRAPDIAYVSAERIPADRRGFMRGAPDLAVEVLSPDKRKTHVERKTREYFRAGAQAVVVIDPASRSVDVHRPSGSRQTLRAADETVDLSDIVPGFRCTVRDIFQGSA